MSPDPAVEWREKEETLKYSMCKWMIIYYILYIYIYIYIYTILPKVLGRPLLMNSLTTLVISMSTNLNVKAYNDILGIVCF